MAFRGIEEEELKDIKGKLPDRFLKTEVHRTEVTIDIQAWRKGTAIADCLGSSWISMNSRIRRPLVYSSFWRRNLVKSSTVACSRPKSGESPLPAIAPP
jgi:hypothetical protein